MRRLGIFSAVDGDRLRGPAIQDRPDPWVPSAGPRQLMVSTYYPARSGTGRPAPFMTTEEATDFLAMEGVGSAIPARSLADEREIRRMEEVGSVKPTENSSD